jgi:hypothetical protein
MIERVRLNRVEEPKKNIRGRPFQPGNPGRPPGSKNKTTRLVEQLLDNEAERIGRTLVEKALAGDARCLVSCLDRLSPRRHGRPIDFELPAIRDVHDVVAAMAAISTGVNDGVLTAEEAGQLAHFIEIYVKAVTTKDIVARLERLESQKGEHRDAQHHTET